MHAARLSVKRLVPLMALWCGALVAAPVMAVSAAPLQKGQGTPGAELNRQEQASPAEPEPQDTRSGVLFRWLNFVLVFGALGYFIAKQAPPVFRARAQAISAEINQAAAEKAEAEKRLREAEAALAHLEEEMMAMRQEAEGDFQAEVERLRSAGKQELEKIEHIAAVEIDAVSRTAQLELRALGAQLAVERAEILVRQQMTADRQETLFRRFVAVLPASAANP